MLIVHTVTSLEPNLGGPSRSIPALCNALAREKASVQILTHDTGENFASLSVDAVIRVPRPGALSAVTSFFSGQKDPFDQALRAAVSNVSSCVFHDHGLWLNTHHFVASAARATRVPLIVSPRGMLSPWALRHKSMKKRIAWLLYQRRDLRIAQTFHATSEEEVQNIRQIGLRQPVALIPNGVEIPVKTRGAVAKGRMKHALFLSRIHPGKGLLDLVRAWGSVQPSGWDLMLAGPDEEGHRKEVERQIQTERLNGAISFVGPVSDEAKWELYRQADLFILPSFSENFGIVVAEAMAAGVPVITTRGTPWSVLNRERCGWWIDTGAASLSIALREAIDLSDEERLAMGARGRRYVQEHLSWQHVAQKMMMVYAWMLGAGARPDFIKLD